MQALITGGTGFIGGAVARALIARGDPVAVLTRDRDRARRVLPAQAEAVEDFGALAAPPNAVVNLAGENLGAHRWTEARKRRFVESRAGTTRLLVDWLKAQRAQPSVLVSGSAVGYYGARGDETCTEDTPPGHEYQSDLCVAWEHEAQRASALGVRVCTIRTGVVLGPGGALAAMRRPFTLGLGGPLGDGRQWMSWIHRGDLVRLILWLLDDAHRAGPYNATAPQAVTNREFARSLGASLHRPAILPMPAIAVKLLVGGMSHLLLTGQKVVPARAQAEGFTFRFPDLAGALADVWSTRAE